VPWKEICPVDERIRFIAAVKEDPRGNFSRLCKRFGISRARGYKCLARYQEFGPAGLEDRKPVPRSCPHKTPDAVIDVVLELRKKHPFDGPKKLRSMMLDMAGDELVVPAASTIGDILARYGLVRPRRARLRVPRARNRSDTRSSQTMYGARTSKATSPLATRRGAIRSRSRTQCHATS
jgi:hypothetical protein